MYMGVFKSKTNILVMIFFVTSLLFVMFSLLFDNKSSNSNEPKYTTEEISIYSTSEYKILDYNTFYTIEEISQQIISALSEGRYKEIYNIFSSDLAEDISKEQYENTLREVYLSNFSDIKDETPA